MNPLLSFPLYLREAYVLRIMLEPVIGKNRTMFCIADNPDDAGNLWASIIVQSPDGELSTIPIVPVEDGCRAAALWREFLRASSSIEHWAEVVRMSPLAHPIDRSSLLTSLVRDGYLRLPAASALFGVQPMGVS